MIRRPPRSTRTDTLFPYTTRFRSKDVKGNVMDGVAEVAGLLERYDACLAKYADPDADYEKICAEQAELEAKIQAAGADRSEEHTSELQSLMRISYAVFCLKKKTTQNTHPKTKLLT